MDFEKSHI